MTRNPLVALFAFLLLAPMSGNAQTAGSPMPGATLPPVVPSGRPAVGLALEGGGALGIAHIGVLKWLEEHHIPVDRLAGTSMGAVVGSLYAEGMHPAEIAGIATGNAFQGVFALQSPYSDLSFRRREDRTEIPGAFTVGLRHGVALRNSLLAGRGIDQFLVTNMASYNSRALDFNTLPIPFRCVATDLNTYDAITFSDGPLPRAVRASVSIPGVFSPVKGIDNHYLVDGGIVDNLPTDVVKHDLGAGVVIGVHLKSTAFSPAEVSSALSVLNRAFSAGIALNEKQAMPLANVVVTVDLDKYSANDYAKAAQLIEAGYQAAEQSRAVLLPYALNDADWAAYLAARQARIRPRPGELREVRVSGGSPGAEHTVRADLKPLAGKPIEPKATFRALKTVQSSGGYSASYETFAPGVAPGSSAIGPHGVEPDTGILVRLDKDTIGPPYLLIGPELAASTSNITQGEMNLRVVDQNLGGYGSEARGTAQVGYRTALAVEYYRLLTPSGYFLQPSASILRQPVYIWANQKRVAERFQQNLAAGMEIGRTVGNTMQISAEWRAGDTRWALRTGSGGGPYLNGTTQTGLLHIDIDRTEAGLISPRGYRLSASAGALYHAVGSANAPLARLSFSRSASWGSNNIVGFGGEVDSYLRANVAQPFRFTLGGPMRLSASSIDEYRGTDLYLAHADFMHRIAPLPTGLGQGLYGLLDYEGGEVWSPERPAFLRQDGTVGLVGNTPIGLVTFGVSVGDAGHRKVFVTLGRWF